MLYEAKTTFIAYTHIDLREGAKTAQEWVKLFYIYLTKILK